MSLMHWKDEYALGDAALDDDHRRVLDLINVLNDSLVGGAAAAAARAIADLDRYVVEHFAREEALMARLPYPRYAEHVAEHARLREEFAALRADFAAGRGERLNTRLLMFLAAWWVRHIAGWDAELIPLARAAAPAAAG